MVKRLILITLALLSLAGTAAAQNEDEAVFAGVFRGKLPATYPFKYNGTYFWDRKDFQTGSIWYNGKQYDNISMNVDAYTNELQVRPLESASPVVVYRDQVAMRTCVEDISKKIRPDLLLIDAVNLSGTGVDVVPIIKGDANSNSIAAASILAKVTRDHIMMEFDNTYPGYGFAKHKGYGTKDHYAAIRELGMTPIHRRSFLKVIH